MKRHSDTARRRLAELLARCERINGKTGALTAEEAEECAALAEQLSVRLVWKWLDLKSGEFHEGRHDANI